MNGKADRVKIVTFYQAFLQLGDHAISSRKLFFVFNKLLFIQGLKKIIFILFKPLILIIILLILILFYLKDLILSYPAYGEIF